MLKAICNIIGKGDASKNWKVRTNLELIVYVNQLIDRTTAAINMATEAFSVAQKQTASDSIKLISSEAGEMKLCWKLENQVRYAPFTSRPPPPFN